MNVYTQAYQETDEIVMVHSAKELQAVMNFCMVNNIDAQFTATKGEIGKVWVPKVHGKEAFAHLQQVRDALSGVIWALRLPEVRRWLDQ